MAEFEKSPRLRRRAGLKRLAGLLGELRSFSQLREGRPGTFQIGSSPFLHFHYHPDGRIVADVRLSNRGFTEFDVTEAGGQQEVLEAIERRLRS